MKLRTMRAVDYWIGIPLCFLCSIAVRLMGKPRGPEKPRRVLFIELSEMGSTVIANPALQKAKDNLGAEIFFLIFERNVDSLKLLDTVPAANIVTIRETSLPALVVDSLRFLGWARRAKIDTVVDLELFSRYSALLTGLSGAMRRVGFYRFHSEGLYRGEMLTHRVNYNGHIHIAKNFVCMVNALLASKPEVPYSKTYVSDEEIRVPIKHVDKCDKERVRSLVREVYPAYEPDYHRLVLINPNSSELLPQRRWPVENFAALAALVVREWDDALVLITGSPANAKKPCICRTGSTTRAFAASPACTSSWLCPRFTRSPPRWSPTTADRPTSRPSRRSGRSCCLGRRRPGSTAAWATPSRSPPTCRARRA